MLSSLRILLLLSVLCPHTSGLCLRLYRSEPGLLCADRREPAGRGRDVPEEDSPLDGWGALFQSAESLSSSSSEESREKRTALPANYRFLSQTKLRGKVLQKGDRRSRFTLSLDVPTNIMNIMFDIAKVRNLHAKAADNARLMAQIGRRK